MSSKNILKAIADLNTQMATLKSELVSKGEETLVELATEVFNEVEGLNKFIVKGWTMGFNDGEPCYHQSCSGFGDYSWEPRSDGNSFFLLGDGIGEEHHEFLDLEDLEPYGDTEDPNTPIVYANGGVKDTAKAYKMIEGFESICEMLYDTNYIVYFTRNEDGSVSVEKEDYDCGY